MNNNQNITQEKILLAMQHSLIGEIYPSIRAVVTRYNSLKKAFTIRYYLDSEPTSKDFENVSSVMSEFISHFKHSDFDDLYEECIFCMEPQSDLDLLDGFVYSRKE
jgi:hypothetical protein